MNSLLTFFLAKSKFPRITDVDLEHRKAGIIRVLLGLIVFVRFLEVSHSLILISGTPKDILYSAGILILIMLFTIGLFTPIVTIALFGSLRLFDVFAETTNLGTIILINALLVLILINHGRYYSVDNILLRGQGRLSRILRKIYSILGLPGKDDISKAYLLGFIIYALISFGALLFHLSDEYWREGVTVKSLLTNSYLGKMYPFFRSVESHFPISFGIFSALGGVFQTVFQGLMLVLIFTRIGKWFVILWGANFILSSLFFINLSYLPHVELFFWLLIFFPAGTSKQKLEIIYDDYCNLCRKSISILRVVNFNGRMVFLPYSKHKHLIPTEKIPTDLPVSIVGVYEQRLLQGYDIYLRAALINPLLWITLPILLAGKIASVGPRIYRFIAVNRYRYFGKCLVSYEPPNWHSAAEHISVYRRPFFSFVYNVYGILFLLFISLGFPVVRDRVVTGLFDGDYSWPNQFKSTIEKIGLHVPGVFNRVDLSMGNHWLILYREEDHIWQKVPLTDFDGSRLNYLGFDILFFSNHNSDVLYFGTTLGYRRWIIDAPDIIDFHESPAGLGWQHVQKLVNYDFKYLQPTPPVRYRAEVYGSTSSETTLFKNDPQRHVARLLYSKTYFYDGQILRIDSTTATK